MRVAVCLAALGLLVAKAAALPVSGDETRPFAAGGYLSVHMKTGELHVRAGDPGRIRVTWHFTGENAESDAERTQMTFEASAALARLEFSGPKQHGVDVEVEVPATTNLRIRLAIGEVQVEGVRGDKSVDLHIGEIEIDMGSTSDYREIDASVHLGDVNTPWQDRAAVFFGTSVKRSFSGQYMLHAHTGIGDVNLH